MKNPRYQLVPITRVFAKLIRDLPIDTVDESSVIEWAGEALEAMGSVPMYESAVAFMEVKNHQAELPNGMLVPGRFAKNNCWTGVKDDFCPATILQDIKDGCDTCNDLPIPLDCNGSPLMDYNIAYYRPYFDLIEEYYGWNWMNSSIYRSCFTPIGLPSGDFELGLDFGNGTESLDGCNGPDRYIIIKGKIVRFNFKDGHVAFSYKRLSVDEETGYPLIPDTYSHTTAITKYITMKMMEKEFYAGRQGSEGRLAKAESDWQWYCGQASAKDMMIFGEDEHQNFLNQRRRLLPIDQYNNFFGKMNIPEGTKWNDPDGRNRTGAFRGVAGY